MRGRAGEPPKIVGRPIVVVCGPQNAGSALLGWPPCRTSASLGRISPRFGGSAARRLFASRTSADLRAAHGFWALAAGKKVGLGARGGAPRPRIPAARRIGRGIIGASRGLMPSCENDCVSGLAPKKEPLCRAALSRLMASPPGPTCAYRSRARSPMPQGTWRGTERTRCTRPRGTSNPPAGLGGRRCLHGNDCTIFRWFIGRLRAAARLAGACIHVVLIASRNKMLCFQVAFCARCRSMQDKCYLLLTKTYLNLRI